MQKFAVTLLVALLVFEMALHSQAYRMTKCQLLKALRSNGFPENQLRDWMCLVEYESGRQTHITSPVNSNGSRDHGLFQINDKYWCSNTSKPGKECNVKCADVKTDNIAKASACAKKIYKAQGFSAWYAWTNKCKGKLPALPSC